MLNSEGYQTNTFATNALSNLHAVVHTRQVINYYRIENSDMERALNIFVRVNSAEPLTLSDMLMSTAIAHWKVKEARKVIPQLVSDVREKGFFIEKDFVLKTCLYLYNSDIRYRVSNFTAARVKPFEDNWDQIRASIAAVFDLAHEFGYNESSLTSKNTLLPILYWVHHKGIADGLTSRIALRAQRDKMRWWLHIMLLKGIIGAGSADTVLAAIRKAFAPEIFGPPFLKAELTSFPSSEIASILKAQGKDPQVTNEFVESLLLTQKDARHAFTILALLAPNLDYKNGNFHMDHLHPADAFKKRNLTKSKVKIEDMDFYGDAENWNSILNLGLLDANENQSKQDTDLATWVSTEANRQIISSAKFCSDRLLPDPSLLTFAHFRDFTAQRRTIVGAKLRALLQ
jgi:hypothetical protein